MEGRGQTEGNSGKGARVRTQSRAALPPNLVRVNEAAKKGRGARFTALMHHIDAASLERAFKRLRRDASAGVDGEEVESYRQNMAERLPDLLRRVRTGGYRALPVRRVYIPKSDGGQRPLGIPALEDKIVQGAVAEVLGAIYEVDFQGFSYGFRPGRGPHEALRAVKAALMTQGVNWVLDADIRNFFGSVDHEWLMRMVEHRIADRRVLRLIRQWLRAGVLEKGVWSETEQGTPQGAIISPVLSNIVLHYVLDLWVQWWRKRRARGRVIIVRYADDFIMGFKYEEDGRRMLANLKERLAKFRLALHEGKTRLIRFGRGVADRWRERRGERPETFAFLGFTHYWGETRTGRMMVKWKTQRHRLAGKLRAVKQEVRRRMHTDATTQHRYLTSVLRGHYQYYGVPGNTRPMEAFHREVTRLWFRALSRRGGKKRLNWVAFAAYLQRYPLPRPHITRPQSFFVMALG